MPFRFAGASLIARALLGAFALFVSHYEIILTDCFAEEPRVAPIINGDPAEQDKWPWMASLFFSDRTPLQGHLCGAALIAPRLILTAAHCVYDNRDYPLIFNVAVGRTLLSSSQGSIAEVEGIFIHPQFDPYRLINDFAILRLATPINSSAISVISSSEEQSLSPHTSAALVGWGTTNPKFPVLPDSLQEILLPLVDNEACRQANGHSFHASSMLCAGTLSSSPESFDGLDACYGDSGGPLMVQVNAEWKLIGLTSWGLGFCANDQTYGVFSKVSAARNWISSFSPRTLAPQGGSSIPVVVPRVSFVASQCARKHCEVLVKIPPTVNSSRINRVEAFVRARELVACEKGSDPQRCAKSQEFFLNGSARGNNIWSFGLNAYPKGSYQLAVRVFDSDGNTTKRATRIKVRKP